MKSVFFILCSLLMLNVKAQTISTFAGCGTMCTGVGDGGPATAAVVIDPPGGVFDKLGNYYFAEPTYQRVRKVDTSGIISTIAGNGSNGFTGDGFAATSAKLSSPSAVRLDTFGNFYIAYNNNMSVRKVNIATGIISTIAGNGTGAFYGDGMPATSAELYGPQDLCFDKKGNLFIADGANARVRKINTMGIISTIAGNGTSGYSGDGIPATNAELALPEGLAVDNIGNVYIADISGNRVRKVDTFGIITTFAGNGNYAYTGDGIPATNAQINPIRLTFDSSGELVIADEYNLRIFKVDNAGIIHWIAGDGMTGYGGDGAPATTASIDYPSGVSYDKCGNLYITDVNNRRVRKVTYNPTCDPYGHGHFDSASLKVNTINIGNVSIYPNPAYTTITISSSANISQVTITNPLGQTVYSQAYDLEKAEVNIAGLPEGVYIVKVADGEGKVTVSKIIKE